MEFNSMEYRQGYSDALELIEDLGLEMTRHAEPPAMPHDYRLGWVTACNVWQERILKD